MSTPAATGSDRKAHHHLHHAGVRWSRQTPDFRYETYSRTHTWRFGGGAQVQGSSAPEFRGTAALPNPEEALVVALSSCHMLSFLAIAARKRLVVERYEDDAEGEMTEIVRGRLAVTRVVLRPRVTFGGAKRPNAATVDALHHRAHEECFIANSVRTEVTVAHSVVEP
ncbi:MAG TPA: OsmC family protein [bacterium]